MEAKSEFDKFITVWNNHFQNKRVLSTVYIILTKYTTEWTSTENKITNLLNNAYLYELVKNEEYDVIFEAIEWLKKEKEILKEQYPDQAEEFNSYISCLNEFEEIIETTKENGFSYYEDLIREL